MKVNKVQQGGPILFVAKYKPGQFLIMIKELPRTYRNYRQASFHHAHMIHVRYFDNLVCGWTGAWVLPFLGQASHFNPYCKHLQLQQKYYGKPNHSMKLVDPNQPLTKQRIN